MVINLTPLTLARPGVNVGTERVDLTADENITVSISRTINTARRIALGNFSTLLTRPVLTATTRKAIGTDIRDASTVYADAEVHYQKLLLDKHELMLSNSGDGDVTVLVIINTYDDRRWVSVNFRVQKNEKVGE